jgi:agmatinase
MEQVNRQMNSNVYLTIDLDVFDPAYMPATGTPEPDGLAYRDIIQLIREIAGHHRIVGMDIVELCPHPQHRASDFFAAKLLYQLLSIIFAQKP